MNDTITTLLEDIYTLEPSLRARENELRPLVEKLLLSKPDTKFDEAFARTLKAQLLSGESAPVRSPYISVLLRRSSFAFAWSFAAIVLLAPIVYYSVNKTGNPVLTMQQEIVDQGKEAFGDLRVEHDMQSEKSAAPVQQDMAVSNVASISARPEAAPSAMIFPPQDVSRYEYRGAPIVVSPSTGNVYKRIVNKNAYNELGALVKGAGLQGVNLSAFSNLTLNTLEMKEDKEGGYIVYVNAHEGTVSISQNWERWNHDVPTRKTPKDAEVISAANAFLDARGISRAEYGAPLVQKNFDVVYGPVDDAMFVSDVVQVIYPLVIDGIMVYDQSGFEQGLLVSVEAADNNVTGVSNIISQSYEKSLYDLETNPQKILSAALNRNGIMYPMASNGTSEVIYLETPTKVLMKYVVYGVGVVAEYYVPALRFPITEQKGSVVVPLPKIFLQEVVQVRNPEQIEPMPAVAPR